MRVYRGFSTPLSDGLGAAVAIGNFDGVHRGHRAVIDRAREHAQKLGTSLGVVTFEPHPREVLQGVEAPARLTPFRRKIELMREFGVEKLFVLPFTRKLMAMSAEDFVEKVLVERIGARAILSGENFRFGYKRSGDVTLLRQIAARHGVEVDTAPALQHKDDIISSTRIRQHLNEGRVAEAGAWLGYAYEVIGRVRTGDRRGRDLGFPTANIWPTHPRTAMPAKGIYAVHAALVDGEDTNWHPAAASLGTNPTFDGHETRLEVHLLDGMNYDLYGRRMRVAFIDWLRGEERFTSIDALVARISEDCDRARDICKKNPMAASGRA